MCEEFENEKKKEQKIFDLPERGFEPQIFSNFPAHDLNFHEREGDKIKSKQSSKRDRTLLIFCSHLSGNLNFKSHFYFSTGFLQTIFIPF